MAKDFQDTRLGRRIAGIDEVKDFTFPEDCGDIGIKIDKNGVWYYGGSPILRDGIWKLFASVLQRDEEGNYWLVTPHERIGVEVEDVPFMAIGVESVGDQIVYEINTGVKLPLSAKNPIYVEEDKATREPRPYFTLRNRLVARLTRSVFYHTLEMSVVDDSSMYLMSGGEKFVLGQTA